MLQALLLLATFVTASATAPASTDPSTNQAGFRLVWQDDFDGPLDTTKWTALDGYVQTQYDLNCYMADDVSTENGNLVLRTRINPTVCVAGGYNPLQTTQSYKYTSGKVDTVGKFSVRNGRIEMNAKLPPPTFRVWPAGWSISDKNNRDQGKCWPLATESASVCVEGSQPRATGTHPHAPHHPLQSTCTRSPAASFTRARASAETHYARAIIGAASASTTSAATTRVASRRVTSTTRIAFTRTASSGTIRTLRGTLMV